MANPRELAEQAFALLQSALRDSEARASELDEQLKRKRPAKNQLEEQLDVLSHRLEIVEAERVRWEQQAGHLEEITEAERAKVAQLKKKLQIAESGPEKLTKKEINFWRAKAEDIDTEIKDYKERFATLRRELMERDALIETLRATASMDAPEAWSPAATAPGGTDELRRQVEQRDQSLAELRHELDGLRAQAAAEPEPPLEMLAEIETLRQQVASFETALADARKTRADVEAEIDTLRRQVANFETALADAHKTRGEVEADLGRAQRDLAERDRIVREAQATSERSRATLDEREHRIVRLSAEVEHLRSDQRQREQRHTESSAQRDEQIAALTRDLDTLRALAQHDATAAQADLGRLNTAVSLAEQRNSHLSTEVTRLQNLLAERERTHGDASSAVESLRKALTARDTAFAHAQQQLAQRDSELDRLKQQVTEKELSLSEHDHELSERDRALADQQQQLVELGQRLADREQRLATLASDLEHSKTAAATGGRELASLREALVDSNRELDLLRDHKQRLQAELSELVARADASMRDVAAKDDELALLHHGVATLQSQRDAAETQLKTLQQQRDAAQAQIAGLDSELKEEREHAENLGELANERRQHMTKLQEQLEEAEERYEEAKWRLGKAMYFERLVKRRKGLIGKLLATLRAKMKANVALKAGLDGLRTFKAAAEMNQQKLLQRYDALKIELREAEEAVARHHLATSAGEAASSESRGLALEARLNTQAELIQSLETDLKSARLLHRSDDEKHQEMERLAKELTTKNQIIERLQTDADEQQRKLSKLRGSESETLRLKAITDRDRSEIDALQREVAQLRSALVRHGAGDGTAPGGDHGDLQAKLKEREHSVTRLMGTIKEQEATIKKLNEAAESWKRKYQFLSSDSPDAYKVAVEK